MKLNTKHQHNYTLLKKLGVVKYDLPPTFSVFRTENYADLVAKNQPSLHSTTSPITYGCTLSQEYIDHNKKHFQLIVDIVINVENKSAAGYRLTYINPLIMQSNPPPTNHKALDQFIEKWLTELINLQYTETTVTI